jgi:hypothetical protein
MFLLPALGTDANSAAIPPSLPAMVLKNRDELGFCASPSRVPTPSLSSDDFPTTSAFELRAGYTHCSLLSFSSAFIANTVLRTFLFNSIRHPVNFLETYSPIHFNHSSICVSELSRSTLCATASTTFTESTHVLLTVSMPSPTG